MANEIAIFLDDIGYPDALQMITSNQITTMKALERCTVEQLATLGCAPHLSKAIVDKLAKNSPTNPADNANSQIVLYEKTVEFALYKKENENEKKVDGLNHQMEMQALRTQMEMEAMRKQFEFLLIKAELERKISEKETEGEIKLMKAQLQAAKEQPSPASLVPPSWGAIPWGPFAPYSFPTDTVLLTTQYYVTIQAWLGSPRHWVLRYRGSRNGFGSAQFHSLCNNVGPTVTIVRANGYLFGSYNPSSWTSAGSYCNVGGSFIFTLTNSHGTAPTPFYCKSNANAMYDNSGYGPTFGGGHDIHIANNCNGNNSSYTNFPNSYNDTLGYGNTTFAGAKNFTVSEIEVFSV